MWSKKKQMLSPKQVQDIWDLEARGLAAVDRDKALRIISRVERVSNTQDSDVRSSLWYTYTHLSLPQLSHNFFSDPLPLPLFRLSTLCHPLLFSFPCSASATFLMFAQSESILMQWKQASSGDESSNAVTPFTYKVFLSSFSTSNFSNPFKGVKVVGDEKLNKKLRVAVLEGLYPSQVRELLLKGIRCSDFNSHLRRS